MDPTVGDWNEYRQFVVRELTRLSQAMADMKGALEKTEASIEVLSDRMGKVDLFLSQKEILSSKMAVLEVQILAHTEMLSKIGASLHDFQERVAETEQQWTQHWWKIMGAVIAALFAMATSVFNVVYYHLQGEL